MKRFVLCALLVGSVTGCGVPADDSARPIDTAKLPQILIVPPATTVTITVPETTVPATTTTTTIPATSAPAPRNTYPVWFIAGDRLESVDRRLQVGGSPALLLEALAAGPSDDEAAERSLRTVLTPESTPTVTVTAGVATVDLPPSYLDIVALDQVMGVGQIVLTLTGFPGIGQVIFTIGGVPVPVPRPDGTQTDGPVTRDVYAALTPG